MKFIKWLLKSLFIAVILLFAINLLGSFVNINIPINIISILIVTLFRLPGAIVLFVFFLL